MLNMFNKVAIFVSVVVIVVLGFFVYRKYFVLNDIHYHAGFRVFLDGAQEDFSGPQYMSLAPCSDQNLQEDEQLEKAHLHDRNGHIVHVHRDGAHWKDLFRNIHYPIEGKGSITAYINGNRVANILEEPIQPYESVIILIGKHGDPKTYLQKAVTRREIIAAEKKSEDCH
jgi:hypothetical protein